MPDSRLRHRLRPRAAVAAALCSLLFLAGCGGAAKGNDATAYADGAGPTVIGTDGSAESRVVAALYGELLADAGVKVRKASTRYSSPADIARAVAGGRIALAPAYETLTLRALPGGQTMPGNMAATLSMALPPGVDALPPARAQNGVVLAVTRATARTHGLRTFADLAKAGRLTLGGPASGDPDAPSTASLRKAYGTHLTESGTPATADVLVLRGTDPVITRDGLVVLTDPKGALPPEHVFPLIGAPYAGLPARKALARLNSPLTTAQLAALTASVNGGASPSDTARTWLRSNGLLG
ncbi:glycine betaine ABC transporter substrate-binding protein [Streptomyces sp. YU58]|uniref:glycine betaine ABC transporter substrate-binding protein n=1 Tax=Streptomyces sp. SX92 TaxID=3158972 RepID=UPI0027BAE1F8|nr:glycine betaine ABC transporter substrate-binding protein [Streptomyces coralus]WLW50296.1 glycine betaine ABC transporter substrate-binding protein [Streptomyces coralus]